jgi:hypothetical protein
MFERKLERDQVRPFHHLVHAGHPTRGVGGTRPSLPRFGGVDSTTARWWERRQPRRGAAKRTWRILAGSEHTRRKALASEVPCFFTVTTPRLTAERRDEPLATMAGARFPSSQGWPRARRSQGGTERSSFTFGLGREERQERQRTNKDFNRWDAGAQRARRIHLGSNLEVEGP